ncbi:MAG TPA: hypothetical protein V6C69_00045, partial [Trichormus sp.]
MRGDETPEPDELPSSIRDARNSGSGVSTYAWPANLSTPEVARQPLGENAGNLDSLPHLNISDYSSHQAEIADILNEKFLGNDTFRLDGIEGGKSSSSDLLGSTVSHDPVLGRNWGSEKTDNAIDRADGIDKPAPRAITENPALFPAVLGMQFDGAGQLIHRDYDNGHASSFEHSPNGQVTKFTEFGSNGQVARQFVRQGDKSEWNVVDKEGKSAGLWQGEIATDEHGSWSYTEFTKGVKAKENRSICVDARGDKTIHRTTDSGAFMISDLSDRLIEVQRPNGTAVQVENAAGVPSRINTDGVPGTYASFAYDAVAKTWHSDQANIADSTQSPLSSDGRIDYKTKDGNRVTIDPNGTAIIHKNDGSIVDLDAKMHPIRCTTSDGRVRTLNYDQEQFVGYTDQIRNDNDPEHPLSDTQTVGPGVMMRPTAFGDLEVVSSVDGNRR